MTLPVAIEEIAYARKLVIEYRERLILPGIVDHPMLTPEGSHQFWQRVLQVRAIRKTSAMLSIIADARAGCEDSDEAMRGLANQYMNHHQLPPVPLLNYVMEYNAGYRPSRRGRKRPANHTRNIAIVFMVEDVAAKFTLRPTRNWKSHSPARRPSACAVIAAALALEMPGALLKPTERAIEKAWEKFAFYRGLDNIDISMASCPKQTPP